MVNHANEIIIGIGSGVTFLGLLCYILSRVFVLGDTKQDKEESEKVWREVTKALSEKADMSMVERELAHGHEQFKEIKEYMLSNGQAMKSLCLEVQRVATIMAQLKKRKDEYEGN